MRVLVITSRFPPNVAGGAEVSASDAAHALRSRGNHVVVLTARHHLSDAGGDDWVLRTLPETCDATMTRGGERRRGPSRVTAFYREAHRLRSARIVAAAVQETSPDVVYVCNLMGIGVVSVLRTLRRIDVPLVYQLESYWWHYLNSPATPYSRVRAPWLKRMLIGPMPRLRFSSCIAVSEAVKREYVRAGCPPARIEVIDNAVHTALVRRRAPAQREARSIRIVTAGRLCPEKGFEIAIAALRELVSVRGCSATLDIFGAGDPAYEAVLRGHAVASGVGERIVFHGRVARDELLRAYDRAALVWVPSVWEEPFGLVAIEAMARGAVVVASAVGGLEHVVEHGRTGVLVPPGNARMLAAATAQLVGDVQRRTELSRAALDVVRTRFSLAARAERVERHLERARTLEPCEAVWRAPVAA